VLNISVSLVLVFESVSLSSVSGLVCKDYPINMAIIAGRSNLECINLDLAKCSKYSLCTNLSSCIEWLYQRVYLTRGYCRVVVIFNPTGDNCSLTDVL
jgi:hypothetical protein